ncbi:thioesterase superfamily protein [Trichosporon asahii var. asahii CBS 8904]|uniref:Thioesterase superfamily protein n=1 Tax=Trichosporon asahii var. asahii (strain CBS 8904) TaxID=1220162 RepID=K1VR12_TRIAC|nr:thioesterase superfamily protein [Trichosporon asahii var. asahii CBS 8904]
MSVNVLKARLRSQYRYFLPFRLRWADNDQYGHVNNSVYNYLIDSVVNTYLIEHCGLKPTDPNPSEPIGLVVASNCNYFSSLEFPGVVDLGLRVSKLGKSSVTYEVGFFKEGVDSVSAVGGFTHVFVHPMERRPTAMVDQMRKGLEKLYVEEAKL